MSFKRITDKDEIRKVMDAYMLRRAAQSAPFLASVRIPRGSVWNGQTMTSPLIIEGPLPLSASQESNGERVYTLTNGDSRYTRAIGQVKLSEVEYIEELR